MFYSSAPDPCTQHTESDQSSLEQLVLRFVPATPLRAFFLALKSSLQGLHLFILPHPLECKHKQLVGKVLSPDLDFVLPSVEDARIFSLRGTDVQVRKLEIATYESLEVSPHGRERLVAHIVTVVKDENLRNLSSPVRDLVRRDVWW